MKRFSHALLQVSGWQAVAGVLKVALPIAVARLLGPTDFGTYSVAIVVVMMSFNLGNLSISTSTTYHVAQARHDRSVTSYNSLVLAGVVGIVSRGCRRTRCRRGSSPTCRRH